MFAVDDSEETSSSVNCPMISVNNLNFTYPGNPEPTLLDVCFEVSKGEVLGFLGPSGAGKSTTQKILIGLLREYNGDVTVMNRAVNQVGQDYYENVGVAFERPNHFLKLTALENLRYFRSLYRGETEDPLRLLELVGLQDDAARRVSQFSKGMKVRLNFARALLNRPQLMFLDEPTTGLDPVNAQIIKEKIAGLQEAGTTVFLTTHNMAVADQVCDRVAFIVDGRLVLIDSPRELKMRYGKRLVRVEYGSNASVQHQEFALDGLSENDDFQQLLRRDDLQTIHSQETTLENIFIEVTGRQLA